MKNLCLILLLLMATSGCYPQNKSSESAFDVKQLLHLPWNSADGLTYREGPGSNLGVTSFEVMGKGQVALLSNAGNEIILADINKGMITKRFPVTYAPRDFAFDDDRFYVLTDFRVDVYDGDGQTLQTFGFPGSYVGVERITRAEGSTYLLLPTGNSLLIESQGRSVEPKVTEGWMTGEGATVSLLTTGPFICRVGLQQTDRTKHEETITTSKKIAGVFVAGASGSRVFLDVQTYVSENPIHVQRKIMILEMGEGKTGAQSIELIIPDVYYVLSNKDFSVPGDGILYQMITAPEGLFIFSLTGPNTGNGYPDFLLNKTYHFNDHLIKVDNHEH